MKTNILVIFTGYMELGGIERSLLALLDSIDYDKCDVDLFLYGHHGPLFHLINSRVNILPEVKELAYLRESFFSKIRHGSFYSAYRRVVDGVRKCDFDESWNKVLRHSMFGIKKEYDLALGFFQPFDLLRDYVTAKVKVGWIHTDYSYGGRNIGDLRVAYRELDYIASVSQDCKIAFDNLLPEYKNKTIVIENCLSALFIRNQAEQADVGKEMPEDGCIRLLSIGRFCEAKNFDNVPDICARIREMDLNIKWYLIGFGPDEQLIRSKIEEFQMQEFVIILGKKENPYPYIKACDLYIQPSRYEGKAVTVREAQILCKPVVITDYATASSQLEDGVDGVVVPIDSQNCALKIASILKNRELRENLIANCRCRDYSNSKEVDKLMKLLDRRDDMQ